MALPCSFDVFCRVVDNYGDAAVCWRLACSLAREPIGARVRLAIDDLAPLRALEPALNDVAKQTQGGVEVIRWDADTDFGAPAQVAVDAFGCGLPEAYAAAMRRSLWIVLEYLSAEPWVADRHGLPSPHPRLPVRRYFFFPGFDERTGGLLRERGLGALREAFLEDPSARAALWRDLGGAPQPGVRVATLFGYESAAVPALLEACAQGGQAMLFVVPRSRITPDVERFMGGARVRGNLEVRQVAFLSQQRYDELLWAADWNFVRGEDSFVRAQWAERPFIWHIYPQEGRVHLEKLAAFLNLYCEGLPAGTAAALRAFSAGWNGEPGADLGEAWHVLAGATHALHAHAAAWARKARRAGDLAMKLAQFCGERLD